MVTAVIAEDEPLARARLQRFLSQNELINDMFVAEDGAEAIKLIQLHEPELLILDINMPAKDGLSVAKEILNIHKRPPAIIFTTAYDEYALEAFDVNAVAYLMKPIQSEQLNQAVVRAGQLNRLQASDVSSIDQKSLILKRSASIESLKVSDIAYFRAADKLVLAGMRDGNESIVNLSLKELEEKLTPTFFRIHRHALVNSRYLNRIDKGFEGSTYSVHLPEVNKNFIVSRRQVATLKKHFSEIHS